MLKRNMILVLAMTLGSTIAMAATYDCHVSKYVVKDKPYGKGVGMECGNALLSTEINNAEGIPVSAYFDSCDGISLSVNNLGDIGGLSVELAKLKPGTTESWEQRAPLRYSVIDVLTEEGLPKTFRVSLGDEMNHAFKANEAIEYSAVCKVR